MRIGAIEFIPQRPPFVMVGTIDRCDEEGATTSFHVTEDNIFLENGYLKEPALVENIAQTAAARIGYICHQEQKPVPIGFIGAVNQLKVHKLPQTGDTIFTTITIKNQIFNATIINGQIMLNGEAIASCEMKIFLT